MTLEQLPYSLTVCKLRTIADADWNNPFYFLSRTGDEISLVCRTEDTPAVTAAREDGWRGLRVKGVLDFSLVGILSRLSGLLARHNIAVFAVSTYNTDYILVKAEQYDRAISLLSDAGYTVN